MEEAKQEVTDSEDKNLNANQNTNENINNINDLPEPDITEEEMKNMKEIQKLEKSYYY